MSHNYRDDYWVTIWYDGIRITHKFPADNLDTTIGEVIENSRQEQSLILLESQLHQKGIQPKYAFCPDLQPPPPPAPPKPERVTFDQLVNMNMI